MGKYCVHTSSHGRHPVKPKGSYCLKLNFNTEACYHGGSTVWPTIDFLTDGGLLTNSKEPPNHCNETGFYQKGKASSYRGVYRVPLFK